MGRLGRLIAIGVMIAVLIAGLVYWLEIPRVVEISPPDGVKNVSAGEVIRLTFSHSMDRKSVSDRLEIEPQITGKGVWHDNSYVFTPDLPWQNNTKYHIHLAKGVRSNTWFKLPLTGEIIWSFTIEDPLIAYLHPADGSAQIYTINPTSGEQKQITDISGEVLDFNVSADGTMIYYSASFYGKGSAIYRLARNSGKSDLLVDCPLVLCRAPQVSPKSDYLAFERTPLSQNEPSGKSQVWIAEILPEGIGTNQNPLPSKPAGNPNHQTLQPLWSSHGWLAYYDQTEAVYFIQTPSGEVINRFPSETGQPGDWDPSEKSFIFPEFIVAPQSSASLGDLNPIPSSHLLRYYIDNEKTTDLTKMDFLEDSAPKFSPNGKSLVFARKYLDIARWTPGRQIWIISLSDEKAVAITDEPHYNHYDFTWKPDSQQIAYVRFDQTTLTESPEIWLTNLDGSGQQLLVRNGYAPQWIP